jgi:hypothetical protein
VSHPIRGNSVAVAIATTIAVRIRIPLQRTIAASDDFDRACIITSVMTDCNLARQSATRRNAMPRQAKAQTGARRDVKGTVDVARPDHHRQRATKPPEIAARLRSSQFSEGIGAKRLKSP